MKLLADNQPEHWLHTPKVYLIWMKMTWLYHLEYRFNAVINSSGSIFWLLVSLLTYHLIFRQIESLAGWSWNEMLILYGVYNLWWGLMVAFFNGGLRIAQHIRNGSLDRILLWPGSALFYAAMKFEPELLIHTLVGLALFIAACLKVGISFQLLNLFIFIILMINSFILIFFISSIFGSTAFWLTENTEIVDFFWIVENLAKYPSEFFSSYKAVFWAIYTVLPVVFIAVAPTEIILDRIKWELIAGAFLATFVFGLLARFVWRAGLRRHTGVSI